MIRFAADENLNRKLVTGLQRRTKTLDIVRVQDAGLRGADDPTVLAWAAEEKRILLTHDVATMSRYAYDRVEEGLPMPGVFEIPTSLPLALGIEELVLIAEVSLDGEWEGQVRYLPLR
ncbi:MAG TPA: DUF5615 family PIN-like protein [Nocardioidaceae bacterium]|nr:DUF5615 family PIN-like protein [Nocardioidaceae bacterium]